ncbi:MAG: hypothetical protein V4719_25560 [Planctomycetota bacterium]
MKIQQLIDDVSKRPTRYFSEPTLSRFDAFLLGWMLKSDDPSTEFTLQGFQEWIANRYGIHHSHSWMRIIRLHATDDTSALNETFKLFEEYFELRGDDSQSE